MARAGLGSAWQCLFANDFDHKKAAAYAANWGAEDLLIGDVAGISTSQLPGVADLAWASFPCQDLSLAGAGGGLRGQRSGTFWPFWWLMERLGDEGRAPKLVVLENVCGALTSHGGKDFAAIADALADGGYYFGALVIDAVSFVPQSRPRLFVVGARMETIPRQLLSDGPQCFHTTALVEAQKHISHSAHERWVWWTLPAAATRNGIFSDLIEEEPTGVQWHTRAQTDAILKLMSDVNRAKVRAAKKSGRRVVGGVYKRTRPDKRGRKVQRAEVRFDDISGCLRTPAGGSSRQTILVVEGNRIRSRLLSAREAARLMGLPDDYKLPHNYNEAYHLAGDGLVVPVVRHLSQYLLEPLVASMKQKKAA
jgi:DNA (cytosine-5)-methyltransferase 1